MNTRPSPSERLEAVLAPDLVRAIEDLIEERVREEIEARKPAEPARKWLTTTEAAEQLGCSPDAVRMRAKRGRLQHRRQGRTLYIAAASIDDLR